MSLNVKQAAFVREYMIDKNGKQAAIRAGYSENTAEQTASRLLRYVKVKEAVDESTRKHAAKCEITRESQMREYERDRQTARDLDTPQLNVAIAATTHISKMFGVEGATQIDHSGSIETIRREFIDVNSDD
mgnify:FL=1